MVENVFATSNESEAGSSLNRGASKVATARIASRRKLAKRRLSFDRKKKDPRFPVSSSSGQLPSTSSTNLQAKGKSRKKAKLDAKPNEKKLKRNERDVEYLATYTKKLTAKEKQIVEQQRTIFKLKISGAIYGSLARTANQSSSRSSATNVYEVREKRTLTFKMPQDVYLSLFQASGTARRLLSVRNKTAPVGFKAFNMYRKEMKAKASEKNGSVLTLNDIGKKWREMDEQARQRYYDKVEQESEAKEEGDGGKTRKASSKNAKQSNRGKKRITIPFLHEVRRFENLDELSRIFGPATLRRNVGTILTPTGRIHVAHVVAR